MITATGAAEIALVASAVRKAGSDRKIVNDMAREIKKSVPPLRNTIRARAVEILPHRGGLGKWVASARITAVVRRSPTSAGVTIRGGRNSRGGRSDLRAIDKGRLRHPTWGHAPWSAQKVPAGFFTDPVTGEGADELRRAVIVAADNAAGRILNGA